MKLITHLQIYLQGRWQQYWKAREILCVGFVLLISQCQVTSRRWWTSWRKMNVDVIPGLICWLKIPEIFCAHNILESQTDQMLAWTRTRNFPRFSSSWMTNFADSGLCDMIHHQFRRWSLMLLVCSWRIQVDWFCVKFNVQRSCRLSPASIKLASRLWIQNSLIFFIFQNWTWQSIQFLDGTQ